MGSIINLITNLHVLTIAIKAVARVGKLALHSNIGSIGLTHLLSFFGVN
jgi:hypothetical protein